MRKAARLLGLIWIALAIVVAAILWVRYASSYYTPGGLQSWTMVAFLFLAVFPGIVLYRWGRGPYQRPVPMREVVAEVYPPKTARDMGHVMQVKDIPHA